MMEKLISFISTLFLFILYPSSADRAKQIELRRIYRELRYLNLAYTGPRGGSVSPVLARKLLELFELMERLKEAVALPVERTELLSSEDLTEYLIHTRLEDSLQKQILQFSYEKLRTRIEASFSHETAWRAVEGEWQDVNNRLSRLNRAEIDGDLFQLELLHALSAFDFQTLLRTFDRTYAKGKRREALHFQECRRRDVEALILDLYYLLGGLKINQRLGELLRHVKEYYHPGFEEKDETAQRIRETVDRLDILFENDLSGASLLSMFRLFRQDPEFEPETLQPKKSYMEEFQRRITLRYEHARDRIQRDILDRRNGEKIDMLFGELDGLEEVGLYIRENEEALYSRGMAGFRYRLPLQAIKTYQQHYYSKGLVGSLRKLCDDGAFEDSNFQIAFQNSIQAVSGISLQLEKFEIGMTNPLSFSMNDVMDSLGVDELGSEIREKIDAYIEKLNSEASGISSHAVRAYQELNRIVEILLDDHRSLKPRHVVNMRVIGGDRNRDIIANIGKALKLQKGLLEILRGYIVVGEIREVEGTDRGGRPHS
jgi:hypothetical protein